MSRRNFHHRRVYQVSDGELTKFIVDYLHHCPDKEQSISYLISWVRDAHLRVSTRLCDAEDTFTRLGFKLRRERNTYGSILRTYVQLGAKHGKEGSEGAGSIVREEDEGLDVEDDSHEA